MRGKHILMSIRPEYVQMILSGEKDVELRRRKPSFDSGTRIYVYSSSPEQAVVAWLVVGSVYWLPTDDLWKEYGFRTGISREKFDNYVHGIPYACAIVLSRVERMPFPVDLGRIKGICKNFHPPQSYQFLNHGDPLRRQLEEQA